jgi:hypothetical protein
MKRYAKALRYAIPALLLLLVLSIPFHSSTIRQNDAAALGKLRRIGEAQHLYATRYSSKGFACRLEDLSEPSQYSGYIFLLSCPGTGANPAAHYQVRAEPVKVGKTGLRAYCSTETGVIWYDREGSGQACIDSGRQLDLNNPW